MEGIGLDAHDTGGAIRFVGADPIFESRHRIGACISIPIIGAAAGAAIIWRVRTGREQNQTKRVSCMRPFRRPIAVLTTHNTPNDEIRSAAIKAGLELIELSVSRPSQYQASFESNLLQLLTPALGTERIRPDHHWHAWNRRYSRHGLKRLAPVDEDSP